MHDTKKEASSASFLAKSHAKKSKIEDSSYHSATLHKKPVRDNCKKAGLDEVLRLIEFLGKLTYILIARSQPCKKPSCCSF
jgi:hypothetical protein